MRGSKKLERATRPLWSRLLHDTLTWIDVSDNTMGSEAGIALGESLRLLVDAGKVERQPICKTLRAANNASVGGGGCRDNGA